jgi:hypothetical protein
MWAAGQVKRKSGFNAIYFLLSPSLLHLRRTARLGLGAGISALPCKPKPQAAGQRVDIFAHSHREPSWVCFPLPELLTPPSTLVVARSGKMDGWTGIGTRVQQSLHFLADQTVCHTQDTGCTPRTAPWPQCQ